MARATITPLAALGAYFDYVADSANSAFTATTGLSGDNGDQFVSSGNDLVIVTNTGSVDRTILFSSVSDPFGRTKDIGAYTLSAGEFARFGPFQVTGWRQTDGNIYLESDHIEVEVLVIAL